MCLSVNEKGLQVAREDIICYKLWKKVNGEKVTPFRSVPIREKVLMLSSESLDGTENKTTRGYHSLKSPRGAFQEVEYCYYGDEIGVDKGIYLCRIPRGSRYLEGIFEEAEYTVLDKGSYASEKIWYDKDVTELIQDFFSIEPGSKIPGFEGTMVGRTSKDNLILESETGAVILVTLEEFLESRVEFESLEGKVAECHSDRFTPDMHGRLYIMVINGKRCEGAISYNKSENVYYFCQNDKEGCTTEEMFGFKYSWQLIMDRPSHYKIEKLERLSSPFGLVPEDHGRSFKATIRRVKTEGKVCYENGKFYLCQNEVFGTFCVNKLGYKASFVLGALSANMEVTDFRLAEEKKVLFYGLDETSHGKYFYGNYLGRQIVGKITVEDGRLFFCQNVLNGCLCNEKHGFYRSWVVTESNKHKWTNVKILPDANDGFSLLGISKEDDGKPFEASYLGQAVEGRIRIENDLVYLCQNTWKGVECCDRLGYDYSYLVKDEDLPFSSFRLKSEPLNPGDVVLNAILNKTLTVRLYLGDDVYVCSDDDGDAVMYFGAEMLKLGYTKQ